MKYTVLWSATAEQSLAKMWADHRIRADVATAANAIDSRLRANPEEAGESREHTWRILLVPPLGVKFRVLSDDRTVQVMYVWQFTTPPRKS